VEATQKLATVASCKLQAASGAVAPRIVAAMMSHNWQSLCRAERDRTSCIKVHAQFNAAKLSHKHYVYDTVLLRYQKG